MLACFVEGGVGEDAEEEFRGEGRECQWVARRGGEGWVVVEKGVVHDQCAVLVLINGARRLERWGTVCQMEIQVVDVALHTDRRPLSTIFLVRLEKRRGCGLE